MKNQFVLGLMFAALIAGCKKDKTDNSAAGATRYLQRFVVTEDGQSVTYSLTYDDKNRLVTYHSQEDSYHCKVTYGDNDNPSTFEIESEGTKQNFEITYNSAGEPVRATSKLINPETPEEVLETEITYEVSNGKVTKLNFADEAGYEAVYELTYGGNNLTKVTYLTGDGELVLTWKYGTKKSPFSAARFKYLVIPDLFSVFSSENEIIESTIVLAGLGTVTQNEEYQYDAGGYPTSSTIKDEDGSVIQTAVYHYKP
ncbi:hypothetical protein ACFOET_00220 [Parapedobacter deserti]|uniref:DUF4595 domain-containing protein n=1 Tax=Parapedobacter deserti TaxID=1912957 RepID=A0ABV7JD29_9SPHI